MAKNLPNIEYETIKDGRTENLLIDSQSSLFQIPFYKDEDYFSNIDSYTKFVKSVEKLVRTSDRYSKYKAYLMDEAKMDHCQVFRDVTAKDADIEMHHGPIFTLFDICSIMVEWFNYKGWKVTTFRVADEVLKEHELNHIQVVMLASTIHEEVHARNIFISMEQAFGDLNTFIKTYAPVINQDMREKFNRYVDRCMVSKSNDYGLLDLNARLWTP